MVKSQAQQKLKQSLEDDKLRGDWWGKGEQHAFESWATQWSWKREGLPDAQRYFGMYKHPLNPSVFLTDKKELLVSQSPPKYNEGFWGNYVTDTDLVLAGYLEHSAQQGTMEFDGRATLQLSAGPGVAGCLTALLAARTTVTDQDEKKMVALRKNAARLESIEGVEPPVASLLPLTAVNDDNDTKASLPWSLILSSDEFLIWDETSATLLVATLSRVSDFNTEIIIAYGRNRNGEEELLRLCKGLFQVNEVKFAELHPVYRTADDDVKVLRLKRIGKETAVGPWHSPKSATLVPPSPHLGAKSMKVEEEAPRYPTRREQRLAKAIKKAIKQQQLDSFAKLPRRCRFVWWQKYCAMLGEMRRSKSAMRRLKALALAAQ